jgi:hypothetical protein
MDEPAFTVLEGESWEPLSKKEREAYMRMLARANHIAEYAAQKGVRLLVCVCVSVCLCVCVCVNVMCVCVCACLHAHAYTHAPTHTRSARLVVCVFLQDE